MHMYLLGFLVVSHPLSALMAGFSVGGFFGSVCRVCVTVQLNDVDISQLITGRDTPIRNFATL